MGDSGAKGPGDGGDVFKKWGISLLGIATLGFFAGRVHRTVQDQRDANLEKERHKIGRNPREEEEDLFRPVVGKKFSHRRPKPVQKDTQLRLCRRCEKIMDWEEANRPMKPRHLAAADPHPRKIPKGKLPASPASSTGSSWLPAFSLQGAKSERKSSLKLLRKRKKSVTWAEIKRKRTVLCFGDSNTWGYDPASQDRLCCRWPRAMAEALGEDYQICEAGMNGRTINKFDKVRCQEKGYGSSGIEHLAPIAVQQKPLDLVIIFLGMNDLKAHLDPSDESISSGLRQFINKLRGMEGVFRQGLKEQTAFKDTKRILLMSPPTINVANQRNATFGMNEHSVAVSALLGPKLEELAKELEVFFLDTSKIIQTSDLDSVHFGAEAHKKLGATVAGMVKDIFAVMP